MDSRFTRISRNASAQKRCEENDPCAISSCGQHPSNKRANNHVGGLELMPWNPDALEVVENNEENGDYGDRNKNPVEILENCVMTA